jgi:anaerobic selenocysteine-containing dehydrogenase
MAMVQLLLGNIGVAGGGMNALRGHSNIQGLTDVGLLSAQIPGYLTLPKDDETTFEEYMRTRQYKPLRPGQTSYWQNYRKFIVSFQKAIYGDAAHADNDWAYDWLPKLDNDGYDILRAFEMMLNGEINGYICQGFNPQQAFPDRGKIRRALGKLKFLVTMDPLDTETSRFWQDFGPQNPSDPAAIQTEVFQLPTTCFAEENGSLVNSSRWPTSRTKAEPSRCAPASCSMVSPSCATTARPHPAAGSSRAATPSRATRWRGATRRTRASRASRRTGRGRGPPTGGSCTTAPAPTRPATPGTRPSRSFNGTAAAGSASTSPTMRRPPSPPMRWVRSS